MGTSLNRRWFNVASAPGSGDVACGSALAGYLGLGAAQDGMAFDGVTFLDGSAWEVRNGCVYTHGTTTLTRGTLEESSTGSAISLSSATTVMLSVSASWLASVDLQLDRGVAVVANAVSTSQAFPSGTSTKISTALDAVSTNTKGWWSTSNKRYLPTEAGNYAVGVFGTLTAVSSSVLLQAQIWKNGAVFARGDAISSGIGGTVAASAFWTVPCNGTTDYIEAYLYSGDSVSRNSESSTGRVGFFAYRL